MPKMSPCSCKILWRGEYHRRYKGVAVVVPSWEIELLSICCERNYARASKVAHANAIGGSSSPPSPSPLPFPISACGSANGVSENPPGDRQREALTGTRIGDPTSCARR